MWISPPSQQDLLLLCVDIFSFAFLLFGAFFFHVCFLLHARTSTLTIIIQPHWINQQWMHPISTLISSLQNTLTTLDLHRISMFSLKTILFLFLAINAAVWYAFQKKMFPKWLTKIISSIYFWPTFPITALLRTGNYWTPIDDTVCMCRGIIFIII